MWSSKFSLRILSKLVRMMKLADSMRTAIFFTSPLNPRRRTVVKYSSGILTAVRHEVAELVEVSHDLCDREFWVNQQARNVPRRIDPRIFADKPLDSGFCDQAPFVLI